MNNLKRFALALVFGFSHSLTAQTSECAAIVGGIPMKMKAVGYTVNLPITEPDALVDFSVDIARLHERDIRVHVKAISVNPVDTKQRKRKAATDAKPVILGYDAAGVVEAVGPGVTRFKIGDEVYYAGEIGRDGSNSEWQAVDERLVAKKPRSLTFAEAASVPLTALTAYEGIFRQLGVPESGDLSQRTLLVIGGAGGVGSMAIQIAKLAGLKVIATASRPETIGWVKEMGADAVLDHRNPLASQLNAMGMAQVNYIFNTADTSGYWNQMAELIKPFGRIVSIVESSQPVDLTQLMLKSASFSWELMFTHSLYQTPEMDSQGEALARVAEWMDEKRLRPTLTETLSPINAANLKAAHALLESGKGRGKIVLQDW